MATMREIWGFSSALTVEADIRAFCAALNTAAAERGVEVGLPSDALDMARDVMIEEAAAAVCARWEVVGNTLRLWRTDIAGIDWAAVAAAAAK